ncbi:uncharacterized protein SOCE26_080870 [Sorangium cellulosum]|uniref:Uncharacterized protein n=1 Tax=Sorangium cellulosum TaxID=56 RepID=A0A2L0F509_SORCE|nr:uncharacterized protein SOCE26_080870 [Sorangium cellulosum]
MRIHPVEVRLPRDERRPWSLLPRAEILDVHVRRYPAVLHGGDQPSAVPRRRDLVERLRIARGLAHQAVARGVVAERVVSNLGQAGAVCDRHRTAERWHLDVIEPGALLVPRRRRAVRVLGALDHLGQLLACRDLDDFERRLVGVVLPDLVGDVTAVPAREPAPERHAAVRRPSVRIEQHLRLARLPLPPVDGFLLLAGLFLRPEIAPAAQQRRAHAFDVVELPESLQERVPLGELRELGAREGALGLSPRADLLGRAFLQPAVRVRHPDPVQEIDHVDAPRRRVCTGRSAGRRDGAGPRSRRRRRRARGGRVSSAARGREEHQRGYRAARDDHRRHITFSRTSFPREQPEGADAAKPAPTMRECQGEIAAPARGDQPWLSDRSCLDPYDASVAGVLPATRTRG